MRLCARCDLPLPPSKPKTARYCSKRCKAAAKESRQRNDPVTRDRELAKERARAIRRLATPEGRARLAAHSARKRGADPVDLFDPLEIFNRDGWMCGLCRSPVDSALAFPDPESASLDHIRPIARGGAHTVENSHLTHFRCNRDKGTQDSRPEGGCTTETDL